MGDYFRSKNGSIGWVHAWAKSLGAVGLPGARWAPAAGADVLKPNETKPQVWPYPMRPLISALALSVSFRQGSRCVSKVAKLKYIARFQSKVGTVLIGRETMCGVILRGDEY
jgi:hypothetical protein